MDSYDDDGDGVTTCEGDCDDSDPSVSPDDDADPTVNPSGAETCNGVDDDCDCSVDEGGVCATVLGCTLYREGEYGGHRYVKCSDLSRSWVQAQAFCDSLGYDIITVGDEAENDWLVGTFNSDNASTWPCR